MIKVENPLRTTLNQSKKKFSFLNSEWFNWNRDWITNLHVSRDTVILPNIFIESIFCELAIIIGSNRRILIGNLYQLHRLIISISSKRLCKCSVTLQMTKNGIIEANVWQINFKITAKFLVECVWKESNGILYLLAWIWAQIKNKPIQFVGSQVTQSSWLMSTKDLMWKPHQNFRSALLAI